MINITYYLLIALGINLLMFIPAFVLKTDKLTDMSYSLTFIILTGIAFFLNSKTALKIILVLMILIWALRLGFFLIIRIRKMKRDKRFDDIRDHFTSFIKFWILQGIGAWLILLPVIYFLGSKTERIFIIGFFIWTIGILIESFADFQKYKFKQDPRNENKFIKKGLWKYSRHPNYFGEIICWIGIYVFVFPSLTLSQQIIGLISPLTITFLLLFFTGIPPLEKYADKKWGNQPEYKKYKKRTSILVPLPRKK